MPHSSSFQQRDRPPSGHEASLLGKRLHCNGSKLTWANRDDDLEARWNEFDPFGTVFADLHPIGAAAGADFLLGLYQLFDTRQAFWTMAKIALRRRSPSGAVGIADG